MQLQKHGIYESHLFILCAIIVDDADVYKYVLWLSVIHEAAIPPLHALVMVVKNFGWVACYNMHYALIQQCFFAYNTLLYSSFSKVQFTKYKRDFQHYINVC